MAPVARGDGVGEEGMVVDLDAQGSVLIDGTDEVEEECLRWVVCGGYQDRSLCAEPDRRDSITVIGWVEEAVLAQTPGGLDGNTRQGSRCSRQGGRGGRGRNWSSPGVEAGQIE